MLLIIFDHDQSKNAFQGVHNQELMDSAEETVLQTALASMPSINSDNCKLIMGSLSGSVPYIIDLFVMFGINHLNLQGNH